MRKHLRILFVSTRLDEDWAAGQRSLNLCRALSQVGKVDVIDEPRRSTKLPPTSDAVPNVVATAKPLGITQRSTRVSKLFGNFSTYKFCPRNHALLQSIVREQAYDLIVVRYVRRSSNFDVPSSDLPCLVDIDDLPGDLEPSQTECGSIKVRVKKLIRVRKIASWRQQVARHDAAWVCKQSDLNHIQQLTQGFVLPNIPYFVPAESFRYVQPPRGAVAVCVASWGYSANVHGLNWFLTDSLPQLRRLCPSVKVRVIGRDMSDRDRDRWSSIAGVEIVGEVGQLRKYYEEASIALVPITRGGGTHVKVVEALAHGVPVVSTTFGSRGFEGVVESGAIEVGDTGADFAEACSRILLSGGHRAAVSRAAFEAAERLCGFDGFAAVVKEGVFAALDRNHANGVIRA